MRTAAGEIRPQIDGELCTMDIGRVRLRSEADYPSGGEDGTGTFESGGRQFDFQFVQVGNPQVAIEITRRPRGARAPALRALHRAERAVPQPHERVVLAAHRRRRIRARIFERGVGETMSSGTGATGAAVAATLRGVKSPVTVVLDGGELVVDVGEDLHVNLTGWARPVYAGTLSEEFLKELNATE